LPTARSFIVRTSAVVADGGGLVFGHSRDAHGAWLVTVRTLEEPTAVEDDTLTVIPALALNRSPRDPTVGSAAPNPVSGILDARPIEGAEDLPTIDVPTFGASDTSLHVEHLGSLIAFTGPATARQALRANLADWSRELVRTVTLEVRVGRRPAGEGPLDPSQASLDSLARQLSDAGRVCGREAERMILLAGEESAYLRSYMMEFGEGRAIPDPVIDTTFAGWALGAEAHASADGQVVLHGVLSWSAPAAPRSSFEPQSPLYGSIDVTDFEHTEWTGSVELEAGRWVMLHQVTLAASGDLLTFLVRAAIR
jgi:hypothetical protein